MIRILEQGEVKAPPAAAVRDVSVENVLVGEEMHHSVIPALLFLIPAAVSACDAAEKIECPPGHAVLRLRPFVGE